MLGVLFLLSFTPLMARVPPLSTPPPPCSRCCDHLEPAEGSGFQPPTFNQVPEVRTFINMTILKGSSAVLSYSIRAPSSLTVSAVAPCLPLGKSLSLMEP